MMKPSSKVSLTWVLSVPYAQITFQPQNLRSKYIFLSFVISSIQEHLNILAQV